MRLVFYNKLTIWSGLRKYAIVLTKSSKTRRFVLLVVLHHRRHVVTFVADAKRQMPVFT